MQTGYVFDFDAFIEAVEGRRRELGLGWYELAEQLWDQSADLNARLDDHRICGGAMSRLPTRGDTSCQYALFLLRWLDRAPEDFLAAPSSAAGAVRLPDAGPDSRLRWDLAELHAALDEQRRERGLTWAELATELGCTAGRLTNLRAARLADLELVMRVTQWLAQPSSRFIRAMSW